MSATEVLTATSDKIISLPAGHTVEPTGTNRKRRPASLPAARFKYRGRQWRIFKRKSDPDAAWNLYFESNKRRHLFSLGTSSKQHAEAEAKLKIDLHFANREADLRRSMQRPTAGKYATIGQITAIVPQLPIDAAAQTRNSYVWSLLWVLERALDIADQDQLNKLSASVLSDDTARRFFEHITAEAAKLDPAKAETFKRTAVTFFDNSRALFAPRSLRAMQHTFGLKLPDLTDWRLGKLHAPAVTDASQFTPPSDAIVRRTLVEWVRLARSPGFRIPTCAGESHGDPLTDLDRRNMFIAIGLMLCFGFRKGEVVRARWTWFDRDEVGPLCRVTNTTQKNKHTTLEVSAVDPFWKVLKFWLDKNHWRTTADDFCLVTPPDQHCDRTYWPFWLIGKWLRHLGWTTQKSNHALRDLIASKLTMKYGLDAARDWCRHGQQATTEKHYNRFRRRAEQLNLHKLAWLRWAK